MYSEDPMGLGSNPYKTTDSYKNVPDRDKNNGSRLSNIGSKIIFTDDNIKPKKQKK